MEFTIKPIEVKSGKDYQVHSALNSFTSDTNYKIEQGIVLSNSREVVKKGKVLYLPIYYVMFIQKPDAATVNEDELIF